MRSRAKANPYSNLIHASGVVRQVAGLTSRPFLIGCLAAALLLPLFDVDAQTVMEGVRRYEAGDYAGAIEEWLPLAESGNASALFNMGQVYRLGRGVSVDLAMAEVYYGRAAELGHVEAMSNLATLLYFGDNARERKTEAVTYWQRAGALGDPRAQYMLGALYFNGDGVPRNNVQAYAWTLLAIDGGSAEAVETGKIIRKYLSDADQRQAVDLAPTLLDREAIEAGRRASAATAPSPTQSGIEVGGGATAAPQNRGKPLLDFSRPPDSSENTTVRADVTDATSTPALSAAETAENLPVSEDGANPPAESVAGVNRSAANPVETTQPADGSDESPAETGTAEANSAAAAGITPASSSPGEISPPPTAASDRRGQSPSRSWSIQLGAFRDVMTARQERDRLSARYADLLGSMDISIVRADLGPARGTYHRLRAGAFASRPEAEAFCSRLIASGAACIVAAPEG